MGVQLKLMPIKSTKTQKQSTDYLLSDTDKFKILYESKHVLVFRFIYGLHGGPIEDVEDLTMKTFFLAWKSRARFQGNKDAAVGWLLTIARNLVIDSHRRRNNRYDHYDIDSQIILSPGLTPEQQFHQKEQIHTLWELIEDLPNQKREIIVLRYILDWRVKDIGKLLEMSENHVSVTIRRILKKIQEKWPKNDR
jgi:RNA polymerase sigma-70 factor (ECF subfamily)